MGLMTMKPRLSRHLTTALLIALPAPALGAPALPKAGAGPDPVAAGAVSVQKAGGEIALSKGRGQLVNLPMAVADVMISNPQVADVQVRSPRQIYIFAKASGESTIFAITSAGKVAYSANLRVSSNVNSVAEMIRLAMPEANVTATAMNGLLLLTGTVTTPEEGAEAERLAKALVGTDVEVVNRTKTATPVQVNLQVRIAEVNRQLVRSLGINLISRDTTGGFLMGVAQGRNFGTIGDRDVSKLPRADASALFNQPAGTVTLPLDPVSGQFVRAPGTSYNLNNLAQGSGKTSLSFAGKLLGLDLASAIDLAENEGLATTLAQPNLTALSGETASFLAGGEIPIPISTQLGQVSIEFKQYGVSLAFTPTVLSDGRISMRVRPEVSQLTTAGAVQLPDALDLLVICAEAGLTVDAAFSRTARELGSAYPELADEFGLTAVEIGFLTDRRQAFLNLAARIPLESIKGVATTMIQTEKYGTPLASALRVLSAEFRNERMMRAEAKAARLPAIMTVPLILFVLPALFIIILGPAACSIMDTLK